jgi:hypothetical protein
VICGKGNDEQCQILCPNLTLAFVNINEFFGFENQLTGKQCEACQ